MSKKTALKPVRIVSREGMQSAVARVVEAKLAHAALTVELEQEIAALQKNYQGRFDTLAQQVELEEAALQVWAMEHPAEFGEKKSIDLPLAVIGFRTTPHRVEKVGAKDTWPKVAARLETIIVPAHEDFPAFNGEDFVREGKIETDKDALLAAREAISPQALKLAGIYFAQDELFYIEPKSRVAELSTKVAA